MIVQCTWHKPIPIFLRDKPPFEENRVSDRIREECMKELFEPAGIKAGGEENDAPDRVSEQRMLYRGLPQSSRRAWRMALSRAEKQEIMHYLAGRKEPQKKKD